MILDESGMTADVDVGRILGAVERAGAKMIVVGDGRRLSPVGPGGALGALINRHSQNVWRLTDNLRQTDLGEQDALAELRSGTVPAAVGWYARNGGSTPSATPPGLCSTLFKVGLAMSSPGGMRSCSPTNGPMSSYSTGRPASPWKPSAASPAPS